jgi:hypothetical protein
MSSPTATRGVALLALCRRVASGDPISNQLFKGRS